MCGISSSKSLRSLSHLLMSSCNILLQFYKALLYARWEFGKDLSTYRLWWKQRNVFLHMCIHPLQTHHNLSRICCNNVHEIFISCRGFIKGLGMYIGFAIFPIVVECQRTKWRWDVSIFTVSSHKIGCHPLTEVRQILRRGNFLLTVLTQQSALLSVHPLSNDRPGDIKKRK